MTRLDSIQRDACDVKSIHDWLDAFARCVRDVDFAGGRRLFASDVIGFGTWTRWMNGREALIDGQWRPVWTRTRGFAFCNAERVVGVDGDDVAWAAAAWASVGVEADGATFPRRGRATFVFHRDADAWIAVHSHFSADPAGTL